MAETIDAGQSSRHGSRRVAGRRARGSALGSRACSGCTRLAPLGQGRAEASAAAPGLARAELRAGLAVPAPASPTPPRGATAGTPTSSPQMRSDAPDATTGSSAVVRAVGRAAAPTGGSTSCTRHAAKAGVVGRVAAPSRPVPAVTGRTASRSSARSGTRRGGFALAASARSIPCPGAASCVCEDERRWRAHAASPGAPGGRARRRAGRATGEPGPRSALRRPRPARRRGRPCAAPSGVDVRSRRAALRRGGAGVAGVGDRRRRAGARGVRARSARRRARRDRASLRRSRAPRRSRTCARSPSTCCRLALGGAPERELEAMACGGRRSAAAAARARRRRSRRRAAGPAARSVTCGSTPPSVGWDTRRTRGMAGGGGS